MPPLAKSDKRDWPYPDQSNDPGCFGHQHSLAIFKSSGTQAKLIRLIVETEIVPCVSPAVLAEYKEVLGRPILRLHAAEAEHILDLLTQIALLVVPGAAVTAASDPDDNCFLECAEAVDADYLITGNKRHFPRIWKKTKIVNTREFLGAIEERR